MQSEQDERVGAHAKLNRNVNVNNHSVAEETNDWQSIDQGLALLVQAQLMSEAEWFIGE